MPLARNAWGPQSALPVAAPKDISPMRTNVLAGVALVGLVMTARHISAATIRELKRKVLIILTVPGG